MMSTRRILMHWFLILAGVFLLGTLVFPITPGEAAVLYVDRTDDDATKTSCKDTVQEDCSLRGAVAAASSGDTIMFDWNIKTNLPLPITITLDKERIEINGKNLSIIGPGPTADQVVIRQTTTLANSRHFYIRGGANVTLELLTLQNGWANTNEAGSIYLYESGTYLTLRKCYILNNTAASGHHGGGVYVRTGTTANIQQSTFTGNTAGERGGGLYIDGGTAIVENSTFSGNKAKYGPAIYLLSGNLTLTHCTITENMTTLTTTTSVEATVALRLAGGSASLTNNLIANNTGKGDYDDCHKYSAASLITASGNLIPSQAYCSPTFTDAVTGLDTTLKYNDGATLNHALQVGSNAVDQVDRALTVDQRGESRPSETGKADIGAYELAAGLTLTADPTKFSEEASTTATVTRPLGTTGALTIILSSSDETRATVPASVIIPDGDDSVDFPITGVPNDEYEGAQTVTITAYILGSPDETATLDVTVLDDEAVTASLTLPVPEPASTDGLGSHTFPTYLLTASYDWLHDFNDHNQEATRDANQTDPDTDNFNKIMVADSNLFPIFTALAGDVEFPNITSRNTALYNDYFNRSVVAAPNFIRRYNVPYYVATTSIPGSGQKIAHDSDDYNYAEYSESTFGVIQHGARSFMQWAFITDPGNHNLRRYEFQKIGGYTGSLDVGGENMNDYGGVLEVDAISGNGVGQNDFNDCFDAGTCDDAHWYLAELESIFSKRANDLEDALATYNSDSAYVFIRRSDSCLFPGCDDGPNDWREAGAQDANGALEFIVTLPEDFSATNWSWTIGGNSSDAASDNLYLGLNARYEGGSPVDPPFNDAGYAGTPSEPEIVYCDKYYTSGKEGECGYPGGGEKEPLDYTFSKVDSTYDIYPGVDGIQVRLSIFPNGKGGFMIDAPSTTDDDAAFAVKRDPSDTSDAAIEARWNKINMYLETVPPESAPAYSSYASAATRKVGIGYTTNTSFTTADNVRFKNPRDVDVYRDVFDTATSITDPDNGGPVYIFVADTMNSRIQVFMNATGSAGETNATFPIRPVRVKGPNDTEILGTIAKTSFGSNELGVRLYDSSGSSTGFGDGRKADWRPFINPASSFVNITQGIGEFYYPHGVAVDQDPDTKDVYLFVADTFNHRIQVFRDATGVTYHNITGKRFDFEYEKGWGTYPANDARPGAFSFKYPKGIDVARFANNSSYLYVVDSKNYRVLKYLLTEQGGGGLNDPVVVAGFGHDGTTFSRTLTSLPGQPVSAPPHKAFEESGGGLQVVGFLNPQDVSTGYSGFYTYSGPSEGANYKYAIEVESGKPQRGVRYLNNYMVYVTDYARNNTSITRDRLNMRVMQFADNYKTYTGVFLPWKTSETKATLKFEIGKRVPEDDKVFDPIWQSPFGLNGGKYNSNGGGAGTGSTENAGREGVFTDRPAGVTALTWDTISPADIRVIGDTSGGTNFTKLYPNGAAIDKDTNLQIGALTRGFFGLPYSNMTSYTNYSSQEYGVDGKGVKRVHVFCYDPTGVFKGHTALPAPPYQVKPNDIKPTGSCTGYMKIIVEDKHFGYSGKTGTMIFPMTN